MPDKVFKAFSEDADMENFSINSTSIRAHQSANGLKLFKKSVGVSRGGRTTKSHVISDGLENPVEFLLSCGNEHDWTHAY